jgi:hypothetical protein
MRVLLRAAGVEKSLGLRTLRWTIEKWVFVDSSGRFWGLKPEKAVHCLGILHYGWAWNLASKMDGTSSEAKPTALGYVFVPWFSTGKNSARDFR